MSLMEDHDFYYSDDADSGCGGDLEFELQKEIDVIEGGQVCFEDRDGC